MSIINLVEVYFREFSVEENNNVTCLGDETPKRLNNQDNFSNKLWLEEREQELEWFVGFSEAESLFFISKSGALSFKIELHWDDRQTLLYIKNLLSELEGRDVGVIVDSKDNHESYFTVAKFKDIQEIIIPIFKKYSFTSSKYLDFNDFSLAAEILLF